jgi:hypothetical protein
MPATATMRAYLLRLADTRIGQPARFRMRSKRRSVTVTIS